MWRLHACDVEQRIARALAHVAKTLDAERRPQLARDVPHGYGDKFALAETLTNQAVAAGVTVLEHLGVGVGLLRTMQRWQAAGRRVSLRFSCEEDCVFVKKTTRTLPAGPEEHREAGFTAGVVKVISKIVNRVDEWHWLWNTAWELTVFAGVDPSGGAAGTAATVRHGDGEATIKTLNSTSPREAHAVHDPVVLDITWLLSQLPALADGDGDSESAAAAAAFPDIAAIIDHLLTNPPFKINRGAGGDAGAGETCRTPRRNPDVDAAVQWFHRCRVFCETVLDFFVDEVFEVTTDAATGEAGTARVDVEAIDAREVFAPVLPLLEALEGATLDEKPATPPPAEPETPERPPPPPTACAVLPPATTIAFAHEQRRSLAAKLADIDATFAGVTKGVLTGNEASLCLVLQHGAAVAGLYRYGVDSIEEALRAQLVRAIGSEISAGDFDAYMKYHARKVFTTSAAAQPFIRAVRREGRDPQGRVAIEAGGEAIHTVSRAVPPARTRVMRFALHAGVDCRVRAAQHVHAYIAHRFSDGARGQSGGGASRLTLRATAAQFSGYVLLLGQIGGPDVFLPQHALVVRNGADFRIPLLCEAIPTPKAFRDAIESLSPEQQRFAKAYRSMQLNATLFALCVVPIRPQMERVLNLPREALAKEVFLTEQLVALVHDFNIPCGMLAYQADSSGAASATAAEQLAAVRAHAAAMQVVVDAAKAEAAAAEEQKRAKARQERLRRERNCELESIDADSIDVMSQSKAFYSRSRPIKKKTRGLAFPSIVSGTSLLKSAPARTAGGLVGPDAHANADIDMLLSSVEAAPADVSAARAALGESCTAVLNTNTNNSNGNRNADAGTGGATEAKVAAAGASTPAAAARADSNAAPATGGGTDVDVDGGMSMATDHHCVDVSAIPHAMDARFLREDPDGCLRPTIIKPDGAWEKIAAEDVLCPRVRSTVDAGAQKKERDRALALLGTLTRCGALDIDDAELHVVVAATHCFAKTLIDTVVQDNANPIEKVERSMLLAASVIHDTPVAALLAAGQQARVESHSPHLFVEGARGS